MLVDEIPNPTCARREGLILSLREIGFYLSGSATLMPSSKDAIDRARGPLQGLQRIPAHRGHTDNVPIHTGRFQSNWELFTARASELIKVFVERYSAEPRRLSAAGYAEFQPPTIPRTAVLKIAASIS